MAPKGILMMAIRNSTNPSTKIFFPINKHFLITNCFCFSKQDSLLEEVNTVEQTGRRYFFGNIEIMGDKAVDLASLLADSERRIDPNTWTVICDGLSITNADSKGSSVNKQAGDAKPVAKHKRRRERLIKHGYALVDDTYDVGQVRGGIEALHKQKIPATFVLLFDETWELACQSKKVLEQATHEKNVFNYDLLAWYIPPGSPGFSPHRDRQPDDAPSTFHSDDQQAKFVTNWIALSDATPENSCLYVIPKPYDPGYTTGDIDDDDDDQEEIANNDTSSADPLHRALSTKESFQHIRSLPRKAGQSILFTHRIIHWGSRGDPVDDDDDDEDESNVPETAVSPRIAISFVSSDPDYEAPLLVNHAKYFSTNGDAPTFPPLYIRLLLVCAQLLIYYQRFDLEKSVIKACYEYCKQHQGELEETYRRKVFVEFVKAMKEQNEVEDKNEAQTKAEESNTAEVTLQINDEDDEEDAMLEEMLNAEAGGYGEFEDDYDHLGEGDDYEGAVDVDDDDDDEDEDEDEEEVDLFGTKRKIDEPESSAQKKPKKTFIT